MRQLIATLLALVLAECAWATAQIPDMIVVDGASYSLFSEPLGARISMLEMGRYSTGGRCSASWRGYQAFWEIKDDQLILERIVVSPCENPGKEVPLGEVFPKSSPPIFASWFSGTLLVPQGKLVKYVHFGYESRYERYLVLTVREGRVIARENRDSPPPALERRAPTAGTQSGPP